MKHAVEHVVIPVAGLGTRMLPLSKALPKELLPLGLWPALFYTIEEAFAAGISQIVLVVSPSKEPFFKSAFSRDTALARALEEKGKTRELALVQKLFLEDRIIYARQTTPAGLGDAIACAHSVVGDAPFCVALPDEHLLSKSGGAGELARLLDGFGEYGTSCVSVLDVPPETTSQYGICEIGAPLKSADWLSIIHTVEKPPPEEAPSTYAMIGRYLFGQDIWPHLLSTQPGRGGEIQLTDAIAQIARARKLVGHVYDGVRYDIGDVEGYYKCVSSYIRA